MNEYCPICNYKMVPAVGPPKSDTLLIGEFPGEEEIKEGRPWAGEGGKILRAELAKAGIAYVNCRATNLWLHRMNDGCDMAFHIDALMKEVEGRKYILLMGSELSKLFLEKPVSDLSGTVTKFGGVKTVVCYNPAIAMHSSVGEVRLAIRRFAELRRGK
jgi:DNA polymerase